MAALYARWNSSLRRTWVNDTPTLVTLVPMLAPMTMKMAWWRVSGVVTTSETANDVVNEELWKMLVARMPTKSPTRGLSA